MPKQSVQPTSAEAFAHGSTEASGCFHCGMPVPSGSNFTVEFAGALRPVCCQGCKAVARTIIADGLSDFYKFRTQPSLTGCELVPEYLRQAMSYDHPEVQKRFVRTEGSGIREASLILEGIVCAACVWLNERHIGSLPGVLEVQINYSNHRARVRWDEARIHLSDIINAITRIGYRAHPYDPDRQDRVLEDARKVHLRRLGVAGVLGMQVMILAVALYAGAWSGMELQFHEFFRWLSLVLTIPVVLYSAQPFFQSAWRDLKNLQPGMDVPVSLGIGAAFAASAWATLRSTGHVYYDSVVMFVFFLLTARYFELIARKRANEASEALVHVTPAITTRLVPTEHGYKEESVAVAELRCGDRVLIRPGETVPADGFVIEGCSSVDESLLTGESVCLLKTSGQSLLGGSINVESPLTMHIEKTGQDTVLSAILRLLDRAQSEKPTITRLADRTASWFVTGVLILAAAIAAYWWHFDPAHWLPITISVLVIACPCALSLATPTAVTAATGKLTRLGLLATRGHALEILARATHWIFDKTGTLTVGRPRLTKVRTFTGMTRHECLRRAMSLERHSEHPLATALAEAVGKEEAIQASAITATPGAGIKGRIDGDEYVVGTPEFIHDHTGLSLDRKTLANLRRGGRTVVLLASRDSIYAAFVFADEIRPGARALIRDLRRSGKTVWLLTGDHEQAARRIADSVDIDYVASDLKPEDKLKKLKVLQEQGAVVTMVGDGVNDAPVLARAQVSIAVGGRTQLAAASADMILLSEQLPHLATGIETARNTLHIIRQNLTWAVAYNLIALPVAAMGFVAPWMAAIGMSASSLLVVVNALRLADRRTSTKAP